MTDDQKQRNIMLAEVLESETYIQGTGALRKNLDKFCCLGVACDLYRKAVDDVEWVEGSEGLLRIRDQVHAGYAPPPVAEWYGWADCNPMLNVNDRVRTATIHNDALNATFPEIAIGFRNLAASA